MSDNSCPFVAPAIINCHIRKKSLKNLENYSQRRTMKLSERKAKTRKVAQKLPLPLLTEKGQQQKKPKSFNFSAYGAEEARTLYLIAASDALSQVSYDPMNKEIVSYFACYMQYIYLFYPEYAYILDNFWTYILFAVIIIRIF